MIARIRRIALAVLVLTFMTLVAPSSGAQESSSTQSTAAREQAAPRGPTVDGAVVGARARAAQPATLDEAQAAIQQRLGLGRARALMIVGFATVIIGLLIGDDPGTLIAIAGAAVGLYGLYHYLR